MALFQQTDGELTLLKQISFESERELQRLVEANLEQVYQLTFIETEFSPYGDLRIDTLAYDKEQNAFVIIEYKNVGSFTVVDQGFAYLSLMLNHKADFVLKYNEVMKETKNVHSFDWSSSRVIFVAPSFTTYQREAANFQGMPYELWEARLYDGDVLSLSKLETSERSAQWSELKIENAAAQQVRREVKVYAEDSHFQNTEPALKEVYEKLKEELLSLDPRLTLKAVQQYIGLKINTRLVFVIRTVKSEIYMSLPDASVLSDPEKKIRTENGSSFLALSSEQDIPYAVLMAKQALDASKSLDAPRTYTVDDLFRGSAAAMRPVYDLLEPGLLGLHPDLHAKPTKTRVSFRIDARRIFGVYVSKSEICLDFRATTQDQFNDPQHKVTDDHWPHLILKTAEDVEYALEMAKQALDINLRSS